MKLFPLFWYEEFAPEVCPSILDTFCIFNSFNRLARMQVTLNMDLQFWKKTKTGKKKDDKNSTGNKKEPH